MIVDAWGIHHDPARYPAPDELRPERFLDGAGDAYGFLTFGGGAHRCIGAALAQLEMRIVLAAVLRRFELAPARPHHARTARRGITLVPHGGGHVRLASVA